MHNLKTTVNLYILSFKIHYLIEDGMLFFGAQSEQNTITGICLKKHDAMYLGSYYS